MEINKQLIETFEQQLDPQNIDASEISAKLIGYGEISSIFKLKEIPEIVFKRMPMFSDYKQAKDYSDIYNKYCNLLKKAGVNLPDDNTIIIKKSKELTVLYIAQKQFDSKLIGNELIKTLSENEIKILAKKIFETIYKDWESNKNNTGIELAIDSQISNWVYNKEAEELIYFDTSTPLFKINGKEQMEPELVLTSTPSFARAIIRKFFLNDVMNRYYDEKSVNIDLIANLYKEQKPELIPLFIEIANNFTENPITEKEIKAYYKEDKFIWQLFLAMRRLDKWLYKYVYKKRYEFILPGRIKR